MVHLKIVSPQNAEKIPVDFPFIMERIKEQIQENARKTARMYSQLRILFPDMDMGEVRQTIGSRVSLGKDPGDVITQATYLAIISADKVVVDDTGLHLEFNHDRKAPPEKVAPPPTSLKF